MKYLIGAFLTFMVLAARCQVKLTAGQRKAVEGIFKNGQNPDMNIRFTGQGDTLFAEPLWAGKTRIVLLPQSPLEFHGTGSGEGGNLKVVFKPDPSGAINEAMVNGGDQ